jgi:nitrogen fixation protein FixH
MIVAGMSVVVAVNVGMVTAAMKSFPGKAGSEGFALSNHYDAVLDRADHQAALGWRVDVQLGADQHPLVRLTGRDGRPLANATLEMSAERPLGSTQSYRLTLGALGDGFYRTETELPAAGQWDLTIQASANSQDFAVTRRIVVP